MKLKYSFSVNEIADRKVAVAVGEDFGKFNGFLKMNDVGAFIFDQLKNDVTEDDIVTAMKAEYADTAEEEIRQAVKEFVAQLKDADMLENV